MATLRSLYIEYNQIAAQIERDIRRMRVNWSDYEGSGVSVSYLVALSDFEYEISNEILWRVTRVNLDDFRVLDRFEIQSDVAVNGLELSSTVFIPYTKLYSVKSYRLDIILDLFEQFASKMERRING